jgi:hypothetical protein
MQFASCGGLVCRVGDAQDREGATAGFHP